MNYEVEQKFAVSDLAAMESRLLALGADAQSTVDQWDQYLAHPARDFATTDEALRIRRIGNENFVTYKGPKLDVTTKTRREIELPITAGQEGFRRYVELFAALGFQTVAEVRKIRRSFELRWEDRMIEIALDEVEGVGTFVELELIVGEHEVDAANACLASLAKHLGLTTNERRSYLEMLLDRRARQPIENSTLRLLL